MAEEKKKICPLSFMFNSASLLPGALSHNPVLFTHCVGENCQWWTDYFVGEEREHDCAVVVIAQNVT
jgi:hypothetical protein